MKDIDKNDAPLGYYAVEPKEYALGGRGECLGCDFNEDLESCRLVDYMCSMSYREDELDVIFKKVGDLK